MRIVVFTGADQLEPIGSGDWLPNLIPTGSNG